MSSEEKLNSEANKGCDRYRSLLEDYAEGNLEGIEKSEIEKHLSGCTSCKKELESLKLFFRTLEDLPPQKAPANFVTKLRARIEEETETMSGKMMKWFFPGQGKAKAWRIAGSMAVLLVALAIWKNLNNTHIVNESVRSDEQKSETTSSEAENVIADKVSPSSPSLGSTALGSRPDAPASDEQGLAGDNDSRHTEVNTEKSAEAVEAKSKKENVSPEKSVSNSAKSDQKVAELRKAFAQGKLGVDGRTKSGSSARTEEQESDWRTAAPSSHSPVQPVKPGPAAKRKSEGSNFIAEAPSHAKSFLQRRSLTGRSSHEDSEPLALHDKNVDLSGIGEGTPESQNENNAALMKRETAKAEVARRSNMARQAAATASPAESKGAASGAGKNGINAAQREILIRKLSELAEQHGGKLVPPAAASEKEDPNRAILAQIPAVNVPAFLLDAERAGAKVLSQSKGAGDLMRVLLVPWGK